MLVPKRGHPCCSLLNAVSEAGCFTDSPKPVLWKQIGSVSHQVLEIQPRNRNCELTMLSTI